LRLRVFDTQSSRRYITFWPFALFAAWVAAWVCDLTLRARFGWGGAADTVYWIAMKGMVWVAPALLAIRTLERAPIADFLGLRNPARGVRWGLGVGAAIVLVNYVGKTLPSGAGLRTPSLDLVFLNAVLVSPIVEEVTLRGFFQTRLALNGRPFWQANGLTTLVFAAMHLPGWYFQGRATTLVEYGARLAPLVVLSLVFGWTKERSGSLYGAILAHLINNLDSAILP